LILTFYMLSREIGERDVTQVLFDNTRDKAAAPQTKQAGTLLPPQYGMTLGRSDTVIVAVFHDAGFDAASARRFQESVLRDFEARHLVTVKALQQTFSDMVSDKVDPAKKPKPDEIMQRFASFGDRVDTLRSSPSAT